MLAFILCIKKIFYGRTLHEIQRRSQYPSSVFQASRAVHGGNYKPICMNIELIIKQAIDLRPICIME